MEVANFGVAMDTLIDQDGVAYEIVVTVFIHFTFRYMAELRGLLGEVKCAL